MIEHYKANFNKSHHDFLIYFFSWSLKSIADVLSMMNISYLLVAHFQRWKDGKKSGQLVLIKEQKAKTNEMAWTPIQE